MNTMCVFWYAVIQHMGTVFQLPPTTDQQNRTFSNENHIFDCGAVYICVFTTRQPCGIRDRMLAVNNFVEDKSYKPNVAPECRRLNPHFVCSQFSEPGLWIILSHFCSGVMIHFLSWMFPIPKMLIFCNIVHHPGPRLPRVRRCSLLRGISALDLWSMINRWLWHAV